ncbi:hypothetical protein [Puia dinghuensis]|uniref:hypothetical protein n=1 Tax=Puia dinghuensis TaxID=1792502 RepID=UPI0016692E1C|nr:hypothetical protein [Puia dinghuensis]
MKRFLLLDPAGSPYCIEFCGEINRLPDAIFNVRNGNGAFPELFLRFGLLFLVTGIEFLEGFPVHRLLDEETFLQGIQLVGDLRQPRLEGRLSLKAILAYIVIEVLQFILNGLFRLFFRRDTFQLLRKEAMQLLCTLIALASVGPAFVIVQPASFHQIAGKGLAAISAFHEYL